MKDSIVTILWWMVGSLVSIPLLVLGSGHPSGWAKWAFWLCVLLLVAIDVAQLVNMIRNGKEDAPDVVGDRNEAVRRQQEILSDAAREKAEIAKLGRKVWLIWGALVAINLMISLFAGMGYNGTISTFACVANMWLLGPLLAFALFPPRLATTQKGTELREQDFPELFAMVREVAKEAGHCRIIRIFFGEQGIGAFRERNYDGILLPSLLARFMTKSELKQVLRHEFAHLVSEEVALEARWLSLVQRMDRALEHEMFFFRLIPDDSCDCGVQRAREQLSRVHRAQTRNRGGYADSYS